MMSETVTHQKILYFSGDAYFQDVLKAIGQAQSEITLESYIFDFDPIGVQILNALEQAHLRGVKVRILIDGVGSYNWLRQITREAKQKSLMMRVYHPMLFQVPLFQILSWRNIQRTLLFLKRTNKRNHRKTIILDRKIIFLGSYNISQVHSEKYMGKNAWRDTGIQVVFSQPSSEEIMTVHRAFIQAWKSARRLTSINFKSFIKTPFARFKPAPKLFRLNSQMDLRATLLRDLRHRMKHSQRRILITNAYFLPRLSVLRAIRKAATRGVYVALLLPAKTDVWFFREASRSLYYRLLQWGVHIFEYKPRVLHAKTMIIDDWATVGSHNFNHRSLIHDLEIETAIDDMSTLEKLLKQWDQDIRLSQPITLEDLGKQSLFRRAISRILYWFRYWI
ncbi:MAG: cardiolipin synthase B [Oligoflexia bacterium]|nr:MAG: cardiolipin synthase B [Oligoflexia bacterium]